MTDPVSEIGPAADNELQAKLAEVAVNALLVKYGEFHDEARRFSAKTLANVVVPALVPLVVAFGDARYREGLDDAANAILDIRNNFTRTRTGASDVARGEG